jgi:hypothetical protein
LKRGRVEGWEAEKLGSEEDEIRCRGSGVRKEGKVKDESR